MGRVFLYAALAALTASSVVATADDHNTTDVAEVQVNQNQTEVGEPVLEFLGPSRQPLRDSLLQLPCSCGDFTCGCCVGMRVETLGFDRNACMNITYQPDALALEANFLMDDESLLRQSIKVRKPPPVCIPVPVAFLPSMDLCVRVFTSYTPGSKLKACLDFEARMPKTPWLMLHFDCVTMGRDEGTQQQGEGGDGDDFYGEVTQDRTGVNRTQQVNATVGTSGVVAASTFPSSPDEGTGPNLASSGTDDITEDRTGVNRTQEFNSAVGTDGLVAAAKIPSTPHKGDGPDPAAGDLYDKDEDRTGINIDEMNSTVGTDGLVVAATIPSSPNKGVGTDPAAGGDDLVSHDRTGTNKTQELNSIGGTDVVVAAATIASSPDKGERPDPAAGGYHNVTQDRTGINRTELNSAVCNGVVAAATIPSSHEKGEGPDPAAAGDLYDKVTEDRTGINKTQELNSTVGTYGVVAAATIPSSPDKGEGQDPASNGDKDVTLDRTGVNKTQEFNSTVGVDFLVGAATIPSSPNEGTGPGPAAGADDITGVHKTEEFNSTICNTLVAAATIPSSPDKGPIVAGAGDGGDDFHNKVTQNRAGISLTELNPIIDTSLLAAATIPPSPVKEVGEPELEFLGPGRQPLRGSRLQLPCSCSDGLTCGCCVGMRVQALGFDRNACMNLTYEPYDFAIEANFLMNDESLFRRSISAKNPPPLCMPVPVPVLPMQLCVKMFDVYTPGLNLHACLDLEARLLTSPVLVLHFDCLVMGRDGVSLVKPGESEYSELPVEPADPSDPGGDDFYDEVTEDRKGVSSTVKA